MNRAAYVASAIGLAALCGIGRMSADPESGKTGEVPAVAGKEEQKKNGKVMADSSAKAILGTWTNEDYDDELRSGRVVYTAGKEGKIGYVASDQSDGSGKRYPGTVTFQKMWTDAKGIRFAKSRVTLEGGFSWITLSRISADGRTLEVQSGVEKIDPKGPRYSIYHRKE